MTVRPQQVRGIRKAEHKRRRIRELGQPPLVDRSSSPREPEGQCYDPEIRRTALARVSHGRDRLLTGATLYGTISDCARALRPSGEARDWSTSLL